MKLTRKQVDALGRVLGDMERAWGYLVAEDTAVCIRGSFASTTLHYARADGRTMYEVEREYGSHLCGLPSAIKRLRAFVEARGELRIKCEA